MILLKLKKYTLIILKIIGIFFVEVFWLFDLILIYIYFPLAYAYKKYVDPYKNFGFLETIALTFLLGFVIFAVGIIFTLIKEVISKKKSI